MGNEIFPLAVIGGGAAGTMATLRAVLNNDRCLLFMGDSLDKKKSRAMWVSRIENMPGFFHLKKGILDSTKETLEWIESSEFKSNLDVHKNLSVKEIKKIDDYFLLKDSKGQEHKARFVVLCTGVMDIQPQIQKSIKPIFPYANVQLADYCLRCDGHHVLNKNTSIIGNTSSAAWVAVMLYERYKTPGMKIFLNGQEDLIEESVRKLLKLYDIAIIAGEIEEIEGDPKNKILKGFKVNNEFISTDIVFISLGMIVYNQLAKDCGAKLDERGFVLTDEKGESSIEGLFVAGDLRANAKKQIYTAWDHAVDSVDTINARLRKIKREELLKVTD